MTAAFWRAWSIWVVSVAATATSLGYTAANPLPASLRNQGGSPSDGVIAVVFITAFATVGALLAWKRPRNPIGWLLSATGLAYAAGSFCLLLAHFPRAVTLVNWLGWIWLLGLGLCVFVVLLFPSGNLPSRRWRPVAWAAGAGLAGWVLGNAFAPTIITDSPSTPNPVGLTGPAGNMFKLMAVGGVVLIVGAGLAAIVSLAFRYRRAQTAERAQLKRHDKTPQGHDHGHRPVAPWLPCLQPIPHRVGGGAAQEPVGQGAAAHAARAVLAAPRPPGRIRRLP